MKRKSKSILLIIFLFFVTNLIAQNLQFPEQDNFCVTDQERKLFNLIAGYRSEHDLPSIEFSSSLSYVARIHAMDLAINRPDFGGCNLHSWSAKGKWKPCCYAKDENRIACMTQKPKELTGYRFKAYEVVYTSTDSITPDDAFEFWKEIPLMNDYLLNTGKWSKHWISVGVGIYGQYACVWFGEGADHTGAVVNCNDTVFSRTDNNITASSYFYIITGNVSTRDQAEAEVKRLISRGFPSAIYLQGKSFFRIATNRYNTESEAYRELESVKKQFPDAWILKPPVNK